MIGKDSDVTTCLVGRCRAFTLLELLVVITSVAVLAAMLLPAQSRAQMAAQVRGPGDPSQLTPGGEMDAGDNRTPVPCSDASPANPTRHSQASIAQNMPSVTPGELGYSVTHWTAEDGLPARIVTCLAQTPDGYLWCGTHSGLARYDGMSFEVFGPFNTPALDGMQIAGSLCDSKGRLWIRGASGALAVYTQGRFHRMGKRDGMPSNQAGILGDDPLGDFWVKDLSDGLFNRFHEGRFEPVTCPGVPNSSIDRFVANAGGLEWGVRQQDRTLLRFTCRGAEVQPLFAPDGEPEQTLGRFFHLRNGRLALTSSRGIYGLRASTWKLALKFDGEIPKQALDGVEDRRGDFWVSFAGEGLVCCEPDGRTERVLLPQQSNPLCVRAVLLDSEGNLWVASDDGLYRLRREAFRAQPGLPQTKGNAANAVVQDASGAVWILYANGMARLKNGHWDYLPNADPDAALLTGAPSRDGGLLLGFTNLAPGRGGYVEKITRAGEMQRLGSVKSNIRVILERRDGGVWVATDRGLWRLCQGHCVRVPITGESGDYAVYALVEDRWGRLLAGVFSRGLFRQEDGVWRRLTTTRDVGSDRIVSLYMDTQNIVWAATDRGLARWNDHGWHAYSTLKGALPAWVRGATSDGAGGLWITSQYGVTRVDRGLLDGIADGTQSAPNSSWFGRSDGLPSVTSPVNPQAILRSTDGRIWVATAKGAAVVDPAVWRRQRERLGAPPVYIEAVVMDGRTQRLPHTPAGGTLAAELVVPPGLNRLEFRYTAVELMPARKIRFRYRLEGLNKDWMEADQQRSVVYHRLPPGHYRFHVTAAGKFGLGKTPGAVLAFIILPHWWQTLWFRIGLGLLVLGVFWISRSVKLRQLHREQNRRAEFARQLIRSQEAERKRIAGELHDSLGQNLLIAKNQLYLAQEMAGSPNERIQPKLRQVADSVGAALEEARTISHRLRPFQLERLGLTKAIRSMIKQTSESTRLPIQAHLEPVDALFPAESEVTIYRILQEGLSNIVKHADASHVEIAIERQGRQVRMAVGDDGRGFDVETMMSAGNSARGLGLTGFQERARLLGGQFHCRSSPGQGTTLTFEIPIPETKASDANN